MIKELYEKFPIMQKLKDERVVFVRKDGTGKIEIVEQCDDWFYVTITKQDAKDISDFFLALSENMTS